MLPKLEKLLLDTDLNVEVRPYLNSLGFRTKFALHVKANERDDAALLRWARRYGYVLVCHDAYRDRDTKLQVYPKLYQNGGRILRISGDSSQDSLTAVGKVIVHRDKWVRWFAEHDGIVVVSGENIIYQYAHDLYTRVRRHLEGFDPPEQIRRRKSLRPRTRPRPKSAQQPRLIS